jgi:Rad3-related DNA helicase
MSYCRGRLSEGIDFKDEYARAVFLIGIPNMQVKDAITVEKKQFLNKKYGEGEGDSWYRE